MLLFLPRKAIFHADEREVDRRSVLEPEKPRLFVQDRMSGKRLRANALVFAGKCLQRRLPSGSSGCGKGDV